MTRALTIQPVAAALLAATALLALVGGCQSPPATATATAATEPAPYLTLDEFAGIVSGGDGVTLVEFCVPAGCLRCDEMRSPIDGLANDPSEPINVRRVNLRQYPALAWEFGVTVCPSYVAFRDGQEVFRTAHPTSADLIVSGIEEALHGAAGVQASLAIQ